MHVRSYLISDSSGSEERKYVLYDQDLDPLRSSIVGTMTKVDDISRANEKYTFLCSARYEFDSSGNLFNAEVVTMTKRNGDTELDDEDNENLRCIGEDAMPLLLAASGRDDRYRSSPFVCNGCKIRFYNGQDWIDHESKAFDTFHIDPCGHEVCAACVAGATTSMKNRQWIKCPIVECKCMVRGYYYQQLGAKYETNNKGNLPYFEVDYCPMMDPVRHFLCSCVKSASDAVGVKYHVVAAAGIAFSSEGHASIIGENAVNTNDEALDEEQINRLEYISKSFLHPMVMITSNKSWMCDMDLFSVRGDNDKSAGMATGSISPDAFASFAACDNRLISRFLYALATGKTKQEELVPMQEKNNSNCLRPLNTLFAATQVLQRLSTNKPCFFQQFVCEQLCLNDVTRYLIPLRCLWYLDLRCPHS